MAEEIVITLWGQVRSKKNAYLPMVINGKMRMIKNSKLRESLNALDCQIPAEYRGLMLVSPDFRLEMTVADGRSDQDGAYTTILDLLKEAKVIRNDSIASFNGRKILAPCVISDHWKTVITLTPTRPTTASLFPADAQDKRKR